MRRRLRVTMQGPDVGEWLVARYGPGAIAPALGRDRAIAAGMYVVHVSATIGGDLGEVVIELAEECLPAGIDVRDVGALLTAAVDAVNAATGDVLSRARQAIVEVVDA